MQKGVISSICLSMVTNNSTIHLRPTQQEGRSIPMPETRNLANFTVRSLILEGITILLEQHYPSYILNFTFIATNKGTHRPTSKKHLFCSKWRSLQTTTIGNPQRSTNHGVPSPIKGQQIVGCQPQWIHLCHKPVSIQGTLQKGEERS